MFCSQCGAKNTDDSLFCSECGAPLHDDPAPQQRPVEQQFTGNQFQAVPIQRKPRKPISKAVIVIAIEAVAAAGLIAAGAKIMGDRCSANTAALEYWKATAECDWGTAYEYCEFPDSEMLTKQMFVNAHAGDTEKINYKTAEVVDVKSVVSGYADQYSDELNSLGALFGVDSDAILDQASEAIDTYAGNTSVVVYQEVGSSEQKYEYVTVSKTGKKQFLFWDEWKVTSSDLFAEQVSINVPSGAAVTVNGTTVSGAFEQAVTEDANRKVITFPYLFTGEYQVSVTDAGMKEYRNLMQVTSYGAEDSYVQLVPDEETLETVCQQAGDDIEEILNAAFDGKSFSAVKDLFSSDALSSGDAKSDYEYILERIEGNGSTSGVVLFSLDDMSVSAEPASNASVIDAVVKADRSVTYRRYSSSGSDSDRLTLYASYVKEGEEWKLVRFPISSSDIY